MARLRDGAARSVSSARRTLVLCLTILAVLAGVLGAAVGTGKADWAPRLGLDLAGGSEIILAPKARDGQKVSSQQVVQAQNIIRQRVDAQGVSGAEVTTRGENNIVVSIPGTIDPRTEQALQASSQMQFRPVLMMGASIPAGATNTTPSTTPSSGGSAADPSASRSATPSSRSAQRSALNAPTATATKDPTDPSWGTKALQEAYKKLDCAKPGALDKIDDDPAKGMVTCSADGSTKYLLGPVAVSGQDITGASAGYQSNQQGAVTSEVAIDLSFNSEAAKVYGDLSSKMVKLPSPDSMTSGITKPTALNALATVLDGRVLLAPTFQSAITNGRAQITGGFSIEAARDLAQQLKFGALPISFQMENNQKISPTLGAEQLRLGFIAGLIGLLLVIAYSVFQYRVLAVVTIGSMVVAALFTYVSIALLGWTYNYRLDMAGVTGLIVAIGVTADSFIVYFERVRDELREGRTLRAAVETGWARAKRTIFVADGVNFIAAAILYLLASSNVRGFAFTLGLTTLIDLAVVWFFTHPMLTLLARRRFFSEGHKWSGLDPEQLSSSGTSYQGRGRFRPRAATTNEGGAA